MGSSVKVDLSGLKKFKKKIEKATEMKPATFEELFIPEFMIQNTEYKTLEEFFDSCGIQTDDDFSSIPQEKLDDFVKLHSKFSSFEEMAQAAAMPVMANRIKEALK